MRVGTRTDVMLFASDILRHAGLIQVEEYPTSGYWSVGLSDGDGARVAITGDRSSLAMIMAAALQQLRPPDPDPDPPGLIIQEADPGASLPEVDGSGEAA